MAGHAARAPAQAAHFPVSGHKTLEGLYSARQRQEPPDLKRDAVAAWRRFRSCLERLPATDAQPLWQLIAAEATTHVR